jgi:hypothetical protein
LAYIVADVEVRILEHASRENLGLAKEKTAQAKGKKGYLFFLGC